MTENKHPESILIGGTTVRNLIDAFWIGLPLSVPQGFRGFDCPSHGPPVAKCTAEWTLRCLMIGGGMFEVGHPWCKSAGSDLLASGQGPKYRSRYDFSIGTWASNYPESALVRCRVSM